MNESKKNKIDVFPPYGFVRLVDYVGDELSIVNAARVSFANESKYEKGEILYDDPQGVVRSPEKLSEKDKGLLNFLLKNKHGTPFEQGFMSQWHIRLPIFVMREWVRHRIGFSINEESGRYTELRPDFYIPEYIRKQTGKPGNYKFEPVDFLDENFTRSMIERNCKDSYNKYRQLLDTGIAKEVARMVLPLNIYTEIRWTANARSFMNFLELRNNEHAMYEIKKYAEALESLFEQHMPNVHKSFVDNERIAP